MNDGAARCCAIAFPLSRRFMPPFCRRAPRIRRPATRDSGHTAGTSIASSEPQETVGSNMENVPLKVTPYRAFALAGALLSIVLPWACTEHAPVDPVGSGGNAASSRDMTGG